MQATFACASDSEGVDAYTTSRLKDVIVAQGADHFVYKTDQQSSLKDCVSEALRQLNQAAQCAPDAVPEQSAVGEYQSNGVPERNAQRYVDLLRTHKALLEDNLKARVPSTHPLMPWLIEHVAMLMNITLSQTMGPRPMS